MSFYGTDFAARRRNRQEQYQSVLQRLLARRQGAHARYAAGSSQLEIEKPKALRNILNNFSGRGMAFSSGYGQEVQNTETDFASQLAQMAAERNAEVSEADLEESDETSNFNYDLSDYQSQQAEYEAEKRQEQVAALAAQRQANAQLRLTRAKAKAAARPPAKKAAAPAKKAVAKKVVKKRR